MSLEVHCCVDLRRGGCGTVAEKKWRKRERWKKKRRKRVMGKRIDI